jgi:hypothetical protein
MAFSVNVGTERDNLRRPAKPTGSGTNGLAVLAILFVAFCIFDYSPYGTGVVASVLADAQRWFQGVMKGLKVGGL